MTKLHHLSNFNEEQDRKRLESMIELQAALRSYTKYWPLPDKYRFGYNLFMARACIACGHSFKFGEHLEAADALTLWISTMKMALPEEVSNG